MKSFYLLTAFGKDRPGIVAQVTGAVYNQGGTIEDATMTRLGGEFTMMLVIGLPRPAAGPLLSYQLAPLQSSLGLTLNIKAIDVSLARLRYRTKATHLISVYGTDKPGIVYRVTQALADQRINITDLNTQALQRTGKPLYIMLIEVQILSRSKTRSLEKTLTRLGRKLRLAVTLQPLETVSL